jgi:hypothetical protein
LPGLDNQIDSFGAENISAVVSTKVKDRSKEIPKLIEIY